ncbi:hypothetical protein PV05_09072 [Exophiala xenobiotica]|uniref:JmjC domain-containing protein n=1 Tax=Exophiala xenobiotica TaxID=348802 RepID=A0A0D2EDU6_9EURO|nr:uncharacterized protein PV05_09072 [Exophiala xenobiotica]KIW53503.1 hypothetical protein PV05_09072 [Exophiala xenobiotica]
MSHLTTLNFNNTFWQTVVDRLQEDTPGDVICECSSDGFASLFSQADEQLSLAYEKLHTFPFKDVKPCWFRLYTDASLAKALKIIMAVENGSKNAFSGESLSDCLDEVVTILDMALIMAGGLGREEIIHQMLTELKSSSDAGEDVMEPPSKRSRLEKLGRDERCLPETFPNDEISIPKLQFPVQHMKQPSMTAFARSMQEDRTPVILTGVLDHWPALERWKHVSYWLDQTFDGRRLVPIEVGRSYTDEDWGQRIVPFRDFLKTFILQQPDSPAHAIGMEHTETGYLAQHDLLRQIPALRGDIATPDYCYLDAPPPDPGTPLALSKANKGLADKTSHPSLIPSTTSSSHHRNDDEDDDDDQEVQTNIWYGPAWTISPLHHDPYHNILCQVVGKKYVRLYSPRHSASLFPRRQDEPAPHLVQSNRDKPKNGDTYKQDVERKSTVADVHGETIDMSNTSTIDVAAMELSPHEDWDEIYPDLSKVPYVECILEAGQALYIPIGWWHYVRSCSVGISVSFWW